MTSKRAGRTKHTTGIGWTHFPDGYLGVEQWRGMTWNTVVGCSRVSPGCDKCYAFSLHDQRFAKNREAARAFGPFRQMDLFGTTETALVRSIGKPLPWPPQYDQPFSTVQMLPDRVDQPWHWRKPRAVFVDSMADLFHEDVTDDYLGDVFTSILANPQHVFMILTKRPERMARFLGDITSTAGRIDNLWCGVSAENQEQADLRIPWLLRCTIAGVLFVSAEPLLAPVDFTPYMPGFDAVARMGDAPGPAITHHWKPRPGLDWILVGGESGKGHRDMLVAWAADIQRQCHEAGVAYFGKQRSDFRSGLALPHPLNEKQFPAAQWGGVQHDIWRA